MRNEARRQVEGHPKSQPLSSGKLKNRLGIIHACKDHFSSPMEHKLQGGKTEVEAGRGWEVVRGKGREKKEKSRPG